MSEPGATEPVVDAPTGHQRPAARRYEFDQGVERHSAVGDAPALLKLDPVDLRRPRPGKEDDHEGLALKMKAATHAGLEFFCPAQLRATTLLGTLLIYFLGIK